MSTNGQTPGTNIYEDPDMDVLPLTSEDPLTSSGGGEEEHGEDEPW